MTKDNSNFQMSFDIKTPSLFGDDLTEGYMPASMPRIRIEDDWVLGSETEYPEAMPLGVILEDFLDAIDALAGGERTVIAIYNADFVVEPVGTSARLAYVVTPEGLNDPDRRVFGNYTVGQDEFRETTISAIKAWCNKALELYPELEKAEWFSRLHNKAKETSSL
ncbi:hypothetical protein [Haloprofundus salinisoli]|uniref:hypothetical protein n=1 Tax=Haloprofundus salinisoli TaxID=2876193 RepID=UPI001CC997F5|nr:hypothetical protein [Haloprofundus salinisoli]